MEFPQFQEALKYIIVLMNEHAKCDLIPLVDSYRSSLQRIVLNPNCRFHVLPIIYHKFDAALIMIDCKQREISLMNPDWKRGDENYIELRDDLLDAIPSTIQL